MIFSVTERGAFKRCRRKAVLTSKNGRHLTKIKTPLALETGTIVHRALELWQTRFNPNAPTADIGDCVLEAGDEAITRITRSYTDAVGVAPSDVELEHVYDGMHFARVMCENYAIHWRTPLPEGYTLLQTEQKVRIPVPGTEHALEGRLDALLQHKSGRIDVLERKTYGQRPKQEDLLAHDQTLAYLWMLKQLGVNTHLSSCVAYDGLWRRDAVPRGRKFEDLFYRFLITRPAAELEEFERFLPIELNHMAELYANPETAYINRDWRGCWDCGVRDICDAMSRGEDHEAVIQRGYTLRSDDTDEGASDE